MSFIRSLVFNQLLKDDGIHLTGLLHLLCGHTTPTKALTHLLFDQYAVACPLQRHDFHKKEVCFFFVLFLEKISLKSMNICKSYSV